MSANDASYLYSVGIDTTKAADELRQFANKTAPDTLKGIPAIQLKVDLGNATSNISNFVSRANQQLATLKPIDVRINFGGSTRSLNAFLKNFTDKASEIEAFQARLDSLTRSAGSAQSVFTGLGTSSRAVADSLTGIGRGATAVVAGADRVASSSKNAGGALDYLGKMANYTIFKFIEWQVAIQGIEGAWNGFNDSIKQGGEVQLEKILQNLYGLTGAAVDTNAALANAATIAKQWGGNIVDIQQEIGLWTKQVHDLGAATLLSNEAEKMARASGISTLEVYRDSVSIGEQMGLTYGQLPKVYDQITRAALLSAQAMRPVSEHAGEDVGAMKQIMQGLTKSAAVLGNNGFQGLNDKASGTAAILAMVTAQINATGDAGKRAAEQLATMFGALSQGGKKRAEWESILGKDAFKDADSLLESMQKHMQQIRQANVDGLLGVRPAQAETLDTLEKNLENIRKLYADIKNNSSGMLDKAAEAEMASYQAQVDKLSSSVQAFEIELGTRLLPVAQRWTNWAATEAVPSLQTLVPEMTSAGSGALRLGAAFLALQAALYGFGKLKELTTFFSSFSNGLRQAEAEEGRARASGFATAEAMQAMQVKLDQLDAALAKDAGETSLVARAWRQLGTEAGLTQEQLGRLSQAELTAGEEAQVLRDKQAQALGTLREMGEQAGLTQSEIIQLANAEERAALQAERVKVGVSEASAAAASSVTGWDLAIAGLGGIAAAALRTLGPLAAMYAAMQAVQSASEGLNKNSAEQNALTGNLKSDDLRYLQARGTLGNARLPGFFQSGGGLDTAMYGAKYGVAALTGNAQYMSQSQEGALVRSIQGSPLSGEYNDLVKQKIAALNQSHPDLVAINQIDDKMGEIGREVADAATQAKKSREYMALWATTTKHQADALGQQMGTGDGAHAFANVPSSSKSGGGTPSTLISQATDAYTKLVQAKEALAARDDVEIKTNETLIGLYGQQPAYINAINGAFADKIAQLKAAVTAGHNYEAQLTSLIQHYKDEMAASSTSAKRKQQDSIALAKAENDLIAVHGRVAEAEAKVAQAEADRAAELEKLRVKQDEQKNGLVDLTSQLKSLSDALQLLKCIS